MESEEERRRKERRRERLSEPMTPVVIGHVEFTEEQLRESRERLLKMIENDKNAIKAKKEK